MSRSGTADGLEVVFWDGGVGILALGLIVGKVVILPISGVAVSGIEIDPGCPIGCLGSGTCETLGTEVFGVVLVVGTGGGLGIVPVVGGTGKVVPRSGVLVEDSPDRGRCVGN